VNFVLVLLLIRMLFSCVFFEGSVSPFAARKLGPISIKNARNSLNQIGEVRENLDRYIVKLLSNFV
jgi:hypothetical protein